MPRWKLVSFDLDGTLVKGTSTGKYIARQVGHLKEMQQLEFLYKQGKVTNADVAAFDGKCLRGYSKQDIREILKDIPTIGHISKTIEHLRSKGILSIICTMAWVFVAEIIAKKYGFAAWSGPSLAVDADGRFTGDVLSDFLETDKPVFVRSYCRNRNIRMSEVIHVGDSLSDIPLFKAVGFSIALNGTAQAKSNAMASVDTESLLDILPIIPEL